LPRAARGSLCHAILELRTYSFPIVRAQRLWTAAARTARQEGRAALADLRHRAAEEKQILKDLSLKRAKELEREPDEERKRTREREGRSRSCRG
jgi:rubrerythrin